MKYSSFHKNVIEIESCIQCSTFHTCYTDPTHRHEKKSFPRHSSFTIKSTPSLQSNLWHPIVCAEKSNFANTFKLSNDLQSVVPKIRPWKAYLQKVPRRTSSLIPKQKAQQLAKSARSKRRGAQFGANSSSCQAAFEIWLPSRLKWKGKGKKKRKKTIHVYTRASKREGISNENPAEIGETTLQKRDSVTACFRRRVASRCRDSLISPTFSWGSTPVSIKGRNFPVSGTKRALRTFSTSTSTGSRTTFPRDTRAWGFAFYDSDHHDSQETYSPFLLFFLLSSSSFFME